MGKPLATSEAPTLADVFPAQLFGRPRDDADNGHGFRLDHE